MAAETEKIILETEVKLGNSTSSVKSLKAELRALTNELANLEPGSQAFLTAAKRAGELQDKMEDAKNAVKAFNPEAKFQAFAGVIGGVANGFAAAQGAMAIFGSDAKELEKVMVKTQGAIALATGLNGLLGMQDSLKLFGAQLKDGIKSLFTLRGALIATGIGAIAVLVGTLVVNWKAFNKAITDAFPAFKVVGDFFANFRQIAFGTIKGITEGFKGLGSIIGKFFSGDFSEAIDEAKGLGERISKAYNEGFAEEDAKIKIENSINARKQQLAILEAQGKDSLQFKLKLQKDELSLLEKGSEEYNAKLVEIETTRTAIRKKGEDDRKVLAEKKLAQEKLEAEAEQARLDFQLDKARKGFQEASKRFDDTTKAYEETREKGLKAINDESKTLEERKQVLDYFYANKLITEKDATDASIKLAKLESEQKSKELEIYANALNAFADLAGKNTAAGKALAIASTTISTYLSAQKAYESAFLPVATVASPILGAIAAAAAVVGGLANIRAIMSVQVPNSGGGGGGGSMPSMPSSAPPIVRPTSSNVNIGNTNPIKTTNQNEGGKVYVLESDITNSQNNVDSIKKKATIK
jgi:hypothetical protein